MSDENFDRKVEFIVEQQAQFAAQIGQLEDLVARFAQATADRFHLTERNLSEHNEQISALISAQIQTEENLRKTDESLKKTDESHKQTEEALRNLIAVVDRYFREGRNGEPKH